MQVIGDIARLNAKRYPDKVALIMENESLTHKQVNQQTNQIAHGLISLGVKPGDRVAILAFNCIEYPIINFAVAKCGAMLVPINFRYKKKELAYVINNSEPKVLFFGPEFLSLVEEAKAEFASPVHLVAISKKPLESALSLTKVMEGRSTSDPPIKVDPDSACSVMYTSGTTGFPKGVLFPHAANMAIFTGMVMEGDLRHEDVTLVCLPLFHNGGLNATLQPTLLMGGTGIITGKGFDPDKILDMVERYGVTMTMWVPTQLAMLINHPGAKKYNVSTLNKIWYGSSPISPTVLEGSMDLFKAGFYQWYGQTETGMVSVLRPEDHKERSQCTGREMFNADLRVVDEEGNNTPVGEVGEIICAQEPLGMIGYYKMDEANKRVVRDGWIHTADLARAEGGGYFTIVDRLTDMIISGAENIYPKEIEDVISSHPGVREVTVFGIPDKIYGEAVCAVVVKKEGIQLDREAIIDFCASKLAGYKKPKRVEFMDDLPKNPSGKVTKNVLRDPYWAGQKNGFEVKMEKASPNQTNQIWTLVEEGLFEYPLAEGRTPTLLANRCTSCRKAFFPRRPLCPDCFEKGKMEEIKLDRRGVIYACTVIHRNSPTGIIAPYAYGYVDIPVNKVRVFGLFVGSDPSSFTPGQEVELVVEPIKIDAQGKQIIGYKFKPVW